MIKKITFIAFACIAAITVKSQNNKDIENLKNLCGCFEVSFKYAETFSPDSSYKFHEREEINGAIELALPIIQTANKISIQHLLIIADDIVIKHWREDWTYENPTIWKYTDTKTWVKEQMNENNTKRKWTQTVWEVSDEPRYQGISQFANVEGKQLWQNTTDAPLPRREYTKRSDYNILNRTNRLTITDSGYVHEQDNKKIIRKNGINKLLVEEKGFNIYKKIEASKCEAAKKYWAQNNKYWLKVENVWATYTNSHHIIKLKTSVDGKMLNQYLNEILKNYNDKILLEAELDSKINDAVKKFIEI